jgi:hypothetical protein
MKDHSIRALLESNEAALSKAATEQRKQSVTTSLQKFLADKKKGKANFAQKATIQQQKLAQKQKKILADTLKAQGWGMGSSGGDYMTFGNPKKFPGIIIQIDTKNELFRIFDETATDYPLFKDQKPIVGPLSLDQLEDQLKNPLVPTDNPITNA